MKDMAPATEMSTVLLGEQTQKQWPFNVVRAGRKGSSKETVGTVAWGWGPRQGMGLLRQDDSITKGSDKIIKTLATGCFHPRSCLPQIGSCMRKGIRNNNLQMIVRYFY